MWNLISTAHLHDIAAATIKKAEARQPRAPAPGNSGPPASSRVGAKPPARVGRRK